ncbi:MAG: FHA domain-containing protein [Deltaproteobacteria bacterium]|nr:FHA domain-containing protein [Deltaproteobacteria bacterium]
MRSLLVLRDGEPILHRLPDTGAVTLGRGADADIRIDDPSLSRRHARLGLGPHVTVEDLGSANGTYVGSVRLAPNRPALLAPGANLELGNVSIVVHVSGSAESPLILSESDGTLSRGRALERTIRRIATSRLAVLVVGEVGAGKSHVAEQIHRLSGALGPIVTLTPELAAAPQGRDATIRAARGGTLVMDDVFDLPLESQASLARTLDAAQDSVRFVATSRRDIANAEDISAPLRSRVAGVTIVVPPLRARVREIATLFVELASEAAKRMGRAAPVVAPDALTVLERHRWPGNVRELQAAAEHAVAIAQGRVVTASHLQDVVGSVEARPLATSQGKPGGALREVRDEAEYQRVMEALRAAAGNQTQAARILGISRGTLIARLERFRVPRPRK